MKKIALIALIISFLLQIANALDFDSYAALGLGNISLKDDQSTFEDGKSIYLKAGLVEEEGMGFELEYSQSVDPVMLAPFEIDFTVLTAYLTYEFFQVEDLTFKARLGYYDMELNADNTLTSYDGLAYGLGINYDLMDESLLFLDYSVNDIKTTDGTTAKLTHITVGILYFF